jgi:large subunit ribosomal protein L4e
MKAPLYDVTGRSKGEVTLGSAFSRPLRKDMIKKAVLAEQSAGRQPYGSDPLAGQRTSADYKGRRGIRGSMMNREMSRMKRITGGGFLRWRARAIAGVVKGRKAHPPKTEKNWEKKMNKKERLLALLSAISATADRKLVEGRGHSVEGVKHVPLIVDDKLQEVKKNREVLDLLKALGLEKELLRCGEKKTRAGRGKTRGRKAVKRKGPLIIVSEDRGLSKAAGSIPGVEVSTVKDLKVGMLAPGTVPGRLTVWTKSAAEAAEKMAGRNRI